MSKTSINKFYVISPPEESHSFALQNLGSTKGGGILMSFRGGNSSKDIYAEPTPITSDDYDEEFTKKIFSVKPVYQIPVFLDYHFDGYLEQSGDFTTFLHHIKYVILPKFKNSSEITELISTWFTQKNNMLISEHLQQKNTLLTYAYEAACKEYPSTPLSVRIDVEGMSEALSYDIATVKRIVNELVADNYATSALGMKFFMITQSGVRYLQSLSSSPQSDSSNININIGDNSVLQFQHGTANSSQKLSIKEISNEDVKNLVQSVIAHLDTLEAHLSKELFESLQADTAYLNRTLQKSNADKTVLQTITKDIFDIIKSVPGNVIANMISAGLPNSLASFLT